jgi:predicted small metal-binding protein
MTEDIFDFGFTAVSEEELEVVQKTAASAEEAAATATVNEDKLNKLYNAILPLLSNLKLNPEKNYIYWPNRTEKVEQFEEMIANIIK